MNMNDERIAPNGGNGDGGLNEDTNTLSDEARYQADLTQLITNSIDADGGPQAWGGKTHQEVIQREIQAAGGAKEYALSGGFPFSNDDIEKFMLEHGQENSPRKYFNDLSLALDNYPGPVPEQEHVLDKKVYANSEKHLDEAFSSQAGLQEYLASIGDIPSNERQSFNAKQMNLLVAEGIASQNPVSSSTLENNYISYKGAKAIGAIPVSHKQENGKYVETIESVFNAKELGNAVQAKLHSGTVDDYNRFSHEDKKEIMSSYYQQEGQHRKFKATGDPVQDIQIAKNRAADYLVKRQLKVWGKKSVPNFKDVNLGKVLNLDKKGQNEFMRDVVKSARIISNNVKKTLIHKEQMRVSQRVEQTKNQNMAPKPKM